jgi:nickel transport protein
MNVKRVLMVIFLLLFLSLPTLASAHKVNVFAWVEGDRIFTESYFPDGLKAAHSHIEVFDEHGNKLLTGKTDSQGMFSFRLPQKEDLKIVLRTPGGHRAEFNLEIEEKPTGEDRPESGHTERLPPLVGIPCITEEEIRAVVEKVLDEKLRPVQKRLLEHQKRGPGITEVLGGIGYIIGLMGVAVYFSHRKKAQSKG